ncbi:type VII secretion AAA-ATPase EccA [Sesbania bispinosa]|nr:type VII secretion AAA-ATPase EccA [Sesbania bispinosa]
MDADFLDYLEKPAEVETAAISGSALKQRSCWGSSAVAEIEERKQDAVLKDLKSSHPEVQQQP